MGTKSGSVAPPCRPRRRRLSPAPPLLPRLHHLSSEQGRARSTETQQENEGVEAGVVLEKLVIAASETIAVAEAVGSGVMRGVDDFVGLDS